METNTLIVNLKADGSENDWCNLAKRFEEYKEILKCLSTKDKGTFSLNVLCILIRNLDSVPTWDERVDIKELLTLSIECIRHTRILEKVEQVKVLCCVFKLHKHIVTSKSRTPPELVLKLSFMPFEYDDDSLLQEYYKTYGHILIDRMTYIEKFKSTKLPILKLLPKLIEDIAKVIKIYDTVQFCTNMLIFFVKKLYYMYNESPDELNDSFRKIFDCLSKKDLKSCQKLAEKDALDLYVKFNECLYTVTENSLKINFKNSIVDSVTRVCVALLGHRPDMFHSFQTVFLNSFCYIFNDKTNPILIDNILKNLLTSCEMSEKLGYESTMNVTYPFISQLLRLYVEYNINNVDDQDYSDHLKETIQGNCLKLVLFLLEKLKKTKQLTKCENCTIKSGLHDALRLSFCVKHFITISTNNNIELKNNLLVYFTIVEQQYLILDELLALKCPNHERCFRKLQIDVHNIAVILNKHEYYEYSIKLFEIYLKYEIKCIKNDSELRNISRALYNKSICELDAKLYKQSLLNAYLSLVFSLPEGMKSEKYISLVIDIKSKVLKSDDDNSDESNELQSLSILHACDLLYNTEVYGNLKMFLKNLKFSSLLRHEFSMYVKLWASVLPIGGVWRALRDLTENKYRWVKVENKEALLRTLFEVVLETPTVVRNIHDACYKTVVTEIVTDFQNKPALSVGDKLVYGAMLLLKSEYDMDAASVEHKWKVTERTADPDQENPIRTIKQEYNAIGAAVQAVEVLTDAVHGFESGVLSNTTLRHIVQIVCVCVQQLLHLHMSVHALQLAYVGCCIADAAGDRESYILNASALVYHARTDKQIGPIITRAVRYAGEFIRRGQSLEAALCLLCDVAIYHIRNGSCNVASKLVQTVQAKLLEEYEKQPGDILELSLGRLMEAQALLCPDSGLSKLSAVNALPRHYLAVRNTATRWSTRRTISLYMRNCVATHGCANVRLSRRVSLWRRAVCAAAATLPVAGAAARASVFVDVTNTHDAKLHEKRIRQLSYILNYGPAKTENSHAESMKQKQEPFIPKQDNVEIMLDSRFRLTQNSSEDSLLFSIPAFQSPKFFQHADTCTCHACMSPACVIIACQISYLEASTYFRAKETEIARNYFDGALRTFDQAGDKFENIFNTYKLKEFCDLAIESAKKITLDEFKTVQLEFLIELSLFELSRNEFAKCDDIIVSIHEILSEFKEVDPHLRNDVANLMVASANLRNRKIRAIQETGLEIDMEELKLSPNKLKTPENKTKMPIITKTAKVVKQEELQVTFVPVKHKLDFDDDKDAETAKTEEKHADAKKKQSKFKIPVPVTSKPVLEDVTPRPKRVIPKIIFQNDVEMDTPTVQNALRAEFFTPCESTPVEFFTPMSAIKKTYTKKTKLVAKNLENEFLTPKAEVETRREKIKDSKSNKYDHRPVIDDLEPIEDDLKPDKDELKSEDDLKPIKDNLKPGKDGFKTGNGKLKKPVKDDLEPVQDDLRPVEEDLSIKKEDSGRKDGLKSGNGKLKPGKDDLKPAKDDLEPAKDDLEPVEEDLSIKKEDSGRRSRRKVETGSIEGLSAKRTIKRATSSRKLVEDKPVSRTRRVKQPGFE